MAINKVAANRIPFSIYAVNSSSNISFSLVTKNSLWLKVSQDTNKSRCLAEI
jgi:hypothetical protein